MVMNKSFGCLLLVVMLAAPVHAIMMCDSFCNLMAYSSDPPLPAEEEAAALKDCLATCPKALVQAEGTTAVAASAYLTYEGVTPEGMCAAYCEQSSTPMYKDTCISACSTSWAASMADAAAPAPAGEAPVPTSPPASGSQMTTYGFSSVVIAFFMALLI